MAAKNLAGKMRATKVSLECHSNDQKEVFDLFRVRGEIDEAT